MGKIEDLGNAYVVREDIQQWYKLLPMSAPAFDNDVVMDAVLEGAEPESGVMLADSAHDAAHLNGDELLPKSHDNIIVSFIDVIGRVRKFNCFLVYKILTVYRL